MNHGQLIADFEAIGSKWWITTYEPVESGVAAQLADDARHLAEAFNLAYTRFRSDSLVSRLNRDRHLEHPPAELVAMIKLAERARELSHGAFDIGVGDQLEALGYDANYSFDATSARPHRPGGAFAAVSSDAIRLKPGSNIDLGGLGKGWLIDQMVEQLTASGLSDFVVNGGGEIRAVGSTPKLFALENPFDSAQGIGEIELTSGAIAASAPDKRSWTTPAGARHHHLIDPLTGGSHNGPAAVYTSAIDTTTADIASTAIYVISPHHIAAFAAAFDVQYLVVDQTGRAFASPAYPGRLYT